MITEIKKFASVWRRKSSPWLGMFDSLNRLCRRERQASGKMGCFIPSAHSQNG